MIRAVVLIFGLNSLCTTAIAEEIILGRWCDKAFVKAEITVKTVDSGEVVAFVKYDDGSSSERELTEAGNGIFRINESPSGDRYRLVPSTGDLQLIDNDGIIRVATRLENLAVPRDCLK